MKTQLFTLMLVFLVTTCDDFKKNDDKELLVVSYNVENLMDTFDNPKTDDDAFLPQSKKKWTTERYNKKINAIADVLKSIDTSHIPDIIALIEIENKTVVEDLLATKTLDKNNYKIVHEETSDPRGIDVALLYNPKIFKYKTHEQIKILDNQGKPYQTREILLVKGLVGNDSLYIFINHWKSRSGGKTETEYKRIQAANTLKNKIQQITNYNSNANIICLGDFNDTPTDKSLSQIMNASTDSVFASKTELYNLAAAITKKNLGTYNYNSKWLTIDNIIISQNMLDTNNNIYAIENMNFYAGKNNTYYHPKADQYLPNKTYGRKYYGGVSDHFPVFVHFKIK